MPRDRDRMRRLLQESAQQLFTERGYELTTAVDIAAKGGVTERTFFRHFSDKREVLFNGAGALSDALASAMRGAPRACGPWDTMLLAFRSVEHVFVANRAFSEPRRLVIANSPALQECEMAKVRSLVAALVSALCKRGIHIRAATLAAQVDMAALSHAVASWLDGGPDDLGDHIAGAFHEVRDLSSPDLGLRC